MPEIHLYDVLLRPVITEKSNGMTEDHNQYVFEVALHANKTQVREAVEFIFNVEVMTVNTIKMPAKRGRRGRKTYIRSSAYKKAVVTLKPGDEIKLFDV